MKELYIKSKVTVLASWFETTGLVALEGGVLGSNIVITDKGYTKDYFKDLVNYCDPYDVESIKEAVMKALNSPSKTKLCKCIVGNFTWEKAAENTLNSYKHILKV